MYILFMDDCVMEVQKRGSIAYRASLPSVVYHYWLGVERVEVRDRDRVETRKTVVMRGSRLEGSRSAKR
jgi:hypothetical protein